MSVISPTDGVDPRFALASSIHASPGVYALLLGSGVSRAAGIPTGYEVVESLAARVATLEGVVLEELTQTSIQWFATTHGHEPQYDELLARLEPTDQDRRVIGNNHSILSALEPTPADTLYRPLPVTPWVPTPGGHQSLASASYRLGGDARMGVAALLEIWLSRSQPGSVLITLDIGLSLRGGLAVPDAIRLWQSALILLGGPILDARGGILPHEADVTHVEIHAAAPESSGQGQTRTAGLVEQLGVRIFGEPTDSFPRVVGQAMRVQGVLDESTRPARSCSTRSNA